MGMPESNWQIEPQRLWLYTGAVPMQPLNLKPTHKLVTNYYQALGQFGQLNIDHEMAVRDAFQDLLKGCGRQFDWTLVPEYSFSRPKLNPIRIDGALLDTFRLPRGYWEAKDEHDDLDKEIRAKLAKGYPRTNIIFQAPESAILYQNGVPQGLNEDITDSANLVELLKAFFGYREPHYEEWDAAVADFKDYIPQIAEAVKEKIENQRRTNPAFVQRFDAFYELCRQSINPNLSVEAVEEMLIQHLMTERIFRRIFDNSDFTRRNVIAVEIEKIIDSMTAREFSRDAFLKDLDRFYRAIELAAENTETYKQKQDFLNTVYERFFQGYSPKEADTHGIVYTPQPIVDFMVRSVEDILKKEFGRSLSDKDVHILDPFVGTGNFIIRVMKEIKTSALPYKYENELHCNEVMLLPYYVASMNIEHEYLERTGEYKAFPGICLVDTFELAEPEQSKLSFMTEENTARVKRQKEAPIFVVIGNPPYNAGQVNENDNNKNRKYPELDRRVNETYARASLATNKNALSDPYVKAIKWASGRIGGEGIVAFVSNNSFLDDVSFDGLRHHLARDFTSIYHFNLKGNARTAGERRRQEGGNIFLDQIRVSVGITFLIRRNKTHSDADIFLYSVQDYLREEAKAAILVEAGSCVNVPWARATSDIRNTWTVGQVINDFDSLLPLGIINRGATKASAGVVFSIFSNGNDSGRDTWVYNFDRQVVTANAQSFANTFNAEVDRYKRAGCPEDLDGFVISDETLIKWTRNAKRDLRRGKYATFDPAKVRSALYHAFSQQFLYPGKIYNKEVAHFPRIFPTLATETENRVICVPGAGNRKGFGTLMTNLIPTLDVAFEKIQCFPFYTYDEDGSNRRENITDWALNEFRAHYSDSNITKWDIFHYVYAVLHHPEYRARYAANLKRELPRIPFVGGTADPSAPPEAGSARDDKQVFRKFAEAGSLLANLHVNYEQQIEYPLERVEKGQLNWRVEKMRLGKDKTSLVYNDFLTLRGIPPETYEYRLGNRSALEWVIDQYQVSTDKRSGITNDPNRAGDPEYIVRLIGQVITVSLETMKIVEALPPLAIDLEKAAPA